MNYPTPEKYSPASPPAQYIAVPGYRQELKLKRSVHDHFDSIYEIDNANASQTTVSIFGFATTDPRPAAEPFISFVIKNTTDRHVEIELFGSYKNRLAVNFGMPEGIEFSCKEGEDQYSRILAMSEHREIFISGTSIRVLSRGNKYTDQWFSGFFHRMRRIVCDASGASYPYPVFDRRTEFDFINPKKWKSAFSLPVRMMAFDSLRLAIDPGTQIEMELFLQDDPQARAVQMYERRLARAELMASKADRRLQKARMRAERRRSQ